MITLDWYKITDKKFIQYEAMRGPFLFIIKFASYTPDTRVTEYTAWVTIGGETDMIGVPRGVDKSLDKLKEICCEWLNYWFDELLNEEESKEEELKSICEECQIRS